MAVAFHSSFVVSNDGSGNFKKTKSVQKLESQSRVGGLVLQLSVEGMLAEKRQLL